MLAEVIVSAKQVERRTPGIGMERCVERDAAADAYLALPLMERKATPAGVIAPDVAVAGRPFADGWPDYGVWIAALWAGDVTAVITGLAARQVTLGEPGESDGETSPRTKLADSLGYLRNQQGG